MATSEETEGMLSPYRVLDLTDEKGQLGGKLLGDLGADVIKVEKPGGDPSRNLGPFYHDEVDPEKSLYWFAFNTSKRGITLDIEKPEGQELFKRLAKSADFIIESFRPGYMDSLGMGYSDLEKVNPGIIVTAITPFGQTGPYSNIKAPDIVLWAMGGRMFAIGDADRPPLRMSHHSQAYIQAALDAAVSALMALNYRQMTGEGQFIDISIQTALVQSGETGWDLRKRFQPRGGMRNPGVQITRTWPCKDGLVTWVYMPGQFRAATNTAFVNWMDNEGMATDFLKEFDWEEFDYAEVTQEIMDRLEEPTGKFFMSHTKLELLEGAVRHRILFYPQFDTTDVLESVQLGAREFWVDVEHPELATTLTYPGPFAKLTETPIRITRRAPLIGEHNREIYEEELGIPDEEIVRLKQAGII
ncbi:MAG: CoA transferase [Dehalococcoidales bacterium]|nr:MAG: CoA transferase [Dehalococcoidales bacterium]